MEILDKRLWDLGATDITYENKKDQTIVRYKLDGKKKKIQLDGWEVQIKIYNVKEKFRPDFTKHKEELDEACFKVDDKFRPVLEEYKKEIKEVTEIEIIRQLEKQL